MFSYDVDKRFVSWNMEPIVFALLKALTPSDVITDFIDERYEPIGYTGNYDLIVFSVKTYNARNAYFIADRFRKMGIKTIAGGYHIMLNPREGQEHFDSIVLGSAESSWPDVIRDMKNKQLKTKYRGIVGNSNFVEPDRSLYDKYRYLPLKLIETSRGCPHKCRFCSTAAVYNRSISFKTLELIDRELGQLRGKTVLFTDENIAVDKNRLRYIARYAGRHNVKWITQADISISHDVKLLQYLANNGCRGLLIGFESINDSILKKYNKEINIRHDYRQIISKMHRYGIMVYGAFILDSGEIETLQQTSDFIIHNKLDLCGLHPLTPFPGTPLYEEKMQDNASVKNWWIRGTYPYFRFVFRDKQTEAMEHMINKHREYIYSLRGISRRIDWKRFVDNPSMIFFSLLFNLFGITEVRGKSEIADN